MFDTRSLADFQRDFLDAVTADPPADPRLRIHHDTWLFGLIDILANTFPGIYKLLGNEAFKAFARDYIRSHPLRDSNAYGDDFAGFLTRHPHLGELLWLPALARYEYAVHCAHHAEDADPCDFNNLLDPQTRVGLHPSTRLVHLDHDIKAAHAAAIAGDLPPHVCAIACDSLIGRDPDDNLIHVSLTPLEAEFLALIATEASLITALERLDPSADDMSVLQLLLARLVQHGQLISL